MFGRAWTECDRKSLYNRYKTIENNSGKLKYHQNLQLETYFSSRVFGVK